MKHFRKTVTVEVFAVYIAVIGLIIAGMGMVGCTVLPPAPPAQEDTRPPQTSQPSPALGVTKGWTSDTDALTRAEIEKYPAIYNVKASRMATLCPKFGSLSEEQRKTAWVSIMRGMALRESSHQPLTMYLESTFKDLDAVTGMPVISEGPYQMSYQDAKWYAGCPFDFGKDASMHVDDFNSRAGRKTWLSKHPSKTILQWSNNTVCAAYVIDRILRAEKHAAKSAQGALLNYWAVMNAAESPDAFAAVLASHRKTFPACF